MDGKLIGNFILGIIVGVLVKSFFKHIFKNKMYEGKLIVCGEGHLEIHIGFEPSFIEIDFCDPNPPQHGCGRHHHDHISADYIAETKSLKIKWHSKETREVSWLVKKF